MDTKRVILATVISLFIIVGWTELSHRMGWTPEPVIAETTPEQVQNETVAPQEVVKALPAAAQFAAQEGREIKVETPLYKASFNTNGAVLTSFVLKNYSSELASNTLLELISEEARLVSPMGILLSGQPTWHSAQWRSDANNINLSEGQASLEFLGNLDGIGIKRVLTFSHDTYLIKEHLELITPQANSARIGFSIATSSLASPDNNYDTMKVTYEENGLEEESSVKNLTKEGLQITGPISWAGLASNYFLTAVAPVTGDGNSPTLKARIQSDVWRVAIEESDVFLKANEANVRETFWWFGPKDRELLMNAPQELHVAVDLGFFDMLARPMLWILSFINTYALNWGISIIILTILIKIAFWPLTKASLNSMEKMKVIQPMMRELQEKYKDNKEEMSKQTMQLYKTYGVNPLGGCLPILVQIPVFFALYQVLLQSLDLRHSTFISYLPFTDIVWLADLSAKDPYYITPILMGASMLIQQLISPAMLDPTQKKMMMLMPVVFTFMFLNFPSGLVLYWLVNNVFSIVQQWYTLRKIK